MVGFPCHIEHDTRFSRISAPLAEPDPWRQGRPGVTIGVVHTPPAEGTFIARGTRVVEGTPGLAARASGRAKGELERARDIRFGAGQSLLVGMFIGWAGMALKLGFNEFIGGDTGYILLMGASVAAAWFGGAIGGVIATVTISILNAVILDLGAPNSQGRDVEQFKELIYIVAGTGVALLVGSRRASRDRLVDALEEVATLAETLETRDTRLEQVLASSGTGFWEWDVSSGRLEWSDAIFHQHGLDPGGPAPTFPVFVRSIHPADRDAFETAIGSVVGGAPSFELDFRVVRPDGSVHWIRGAGRMFRDDAGAAVRMTGTGQDITDARRLEAEREQMLAAERRAGAFREAFIEIISHELRTPITTILGLTEILARTGRSAGELSGQLSGELLEDVRAESERLHRLVEDLVVLSRVERGGLEVDNEPLDTRRLLERVIGHQASDLTSIRIHLQLAPDLPIVAGEATYVEQILRNLLGNAAKYAPAGTEVIVSARRRGATVEVRVSDNGPGIPKVSQRRAFELFYRDPDSARVVAGSGIGLFVCASLVEAMGGRIWAKRRPTGGAEFGFTLRVLEADPDDDDVFVIAPPLAAPASPEPGA